MNEGWFAVRKKAVLFEALMLVAAVWAVGFAFADPAGFLVLSQNKGAVHSYFEGGKLKQQYVDQMNAQAGKVPQELASLFGNNKINVYITLDDGSTATYYVVTKDAKVDEVLDSTQGNADLEVRLSEKTIDMVALSKDPVGDFLKAMSSGEIKYRGLTPEGETKGLIVNIATGIIGFFKGLLDFLGSLLK